MNKPIQFCDERKNKLPRKGLPQAAPVCVKSFIMVWLAALVTAFLSAQAGFCGTENAEGLPDTNGFGSNNYQAKARPIIPWKVQAFDLQDVRLLDGPFKRSEETHAKYLLSLEPDRLLARFRSEAGLKPKAANYPGWEDKTLPGVGAGFYLSGCSRLYASTGDTRFLDRVNYVLSELAECQKANGNGYLLATKGGKRIFADLERGNIHISDTWRINGECEPYYAMEKLFSGLRDAYRVAGQRQALDIEVALGDWLDRHVAHFTDEQMQLIMSCEFGGINWVVADLYADTGDARYMALSKRWQHKEILDPLSKGIDILPGKHANTQFPKISGLASRYPWSGDPSDRITAEFFWNRVVHHHSYVTGNCSQNEHFGPPDKLDSRLGIDNTETCNAWNMVRLTDLLERIEPRAEYGDFVERILWNHILSVQNPDDGRICYFQPLAAGNIKPYETLYEGFRCCTCSSFDSYARHGDSIYYHDSDTLYLNLFIPSKVNWKNKGVVLRQETQIPYDDIVKLTCACAKPVGFMLAIRCPYWATEGLTATVNGVRQEVVGMAGNFLVLDRTWQAGDVVTLNIPMPLRTEAMPDNPNRIAFFKGPVLLAGDLGPAQDSEAGNPAYVPMLVSSGQTLSSWLKSVDSSKLSYRLDGVGQPRDVTLAPLYTLHARRYAVYWDEKTPAQWKAIAAGREAEEAHAREMTTRTIDKVDVGLPASEAAHQMKAFQSKGGKLMWMGGEFHYREASDGWFSYDLKVVRDTPLELVASYWGKEIGSRTFDMLVDNTIIGATSLDNSRPEGFYDVTYPIPANFTQGKESVTVKLQAHPGSVAGGVYDLRIVKPKSSLNK
jgi:DUF1680 family protein